MLRKSVVAGTLAAVGASSLKLAAEENSWIRILYCGVFILSNILVWWLQLGAMSDSEATVEPLVVFTGANFVASGLLGWLFHAESHGTYWFIGLAFVIAGISVIKRRS